MRSIRSLLIVIILLIAGCYFLLQYNSYFSDGEIQLELNEISDLPKLKSNQESKKTTELLNGDIFDMIGASGDELIEILGSKPDRKDLSAYGYEWWIFQNGSDQYIQVGVEDDTVKTIYGIGDKLTSSPFEIGTSYDEIEKKFPFKNKITYQKGISFYSFLLKDEDLKTNPLIKLSDDLFLQCYFDSFTGKLSSIRLATGEIMLRQRFYEMEYRGNLPEEVTFSDEDWNTIEKGMERQIYDLTNINREKFDLNPLIFDDNVSKVAFSHSKDMFDQNYFSHYRPDGGGLKERLSEKEIYYLAAGENIAAQHSDAPAAVEGWMNSEGHREALLNEEYTHIGIGVYRLYYTQNFILKP